MIKVAQSSIHQCHQMMQLLLLNLRANGLHLLIMLISLFITTLSSILSSKFYISTHLSYIKIALINSNACICVTINSTKPVNIELGSELQVNENWVCGIGMTSVRSNNINNRSSLIVGSSVMINDNTHLSFTSIVFPQGISVTMPSPFPCVRSHHLTIVVILILLGESS
jgi:hypothetical protein